MNQQPITVTATVLAPLAQVWQRWTNPADIQAWNQATDDWHTPSAINDLRQNGRFSYRMAARDGTVAFDFAGRYDEVMPHTLIAYTLDDGRKVTVRFLEHGDSVAITETFETEQQNSAELQQAGWQAILNSFKRYVERATD